MDSLRSHLHNGACHACGPDTYYPKMTITSSLQTYETMLSAQRRADGHLRLLSKGSSIHFAYLHIRLSWVLPTTNAQRKDDKCHKTVCTFHSHTTTQLSTKFATGINTNNKPRQIYLKSYQYNIQHNAYFTQGENCT
jgi:hypothetical protein